MIDVKFRNARMLDLVSGQASAPHDVVVSQGRVYRSSLPGTPADDDEQIDLQGRFMMPGLWDGHAHFDLWAETAQRLDVHDATSAGHAITAVAERIGTHHDDPVIAMGARDWTWPDQPSTTELDAATGDHPVVIVMKNLHTVWANSAALRRWGFTSRADGTAVSGLLREEDAFAMQDRFAASDGPLLERWVEQAQEQAARRGLIGISDVQHSPDRLATWQRRESSGNQKLHVEMACWPDTMDMALAEGMRTGINAPDSQWLSGGSLKIIADGSLTASTAWSRDRYQSPTDDGSPHGISLVSTRELSELMSRAELSGLNVAVHAIGDAAVDQAIGCFAETGAHGSIEHAVIARDDDIHRMAELGLIASVQPAHLIDDQSLIDAQWPESSEWAFPLADYASAGVSLIFGSDAPVVPLDPWLGIQTAVLRSSPGGQAWHPHQCLSISQALRASTHGISQLVPGGQADLIVLDENPLDADPQSLATIQPFLTMAQGTITWWDI